VSRASEHGAVGGHGTIGSYLTGFVFAVILTAIPFALVIGKVLPPAETLGVVFGAALIQGFVHLYYFLHIDASAEARSNLLAIFYTVIILTIIIGGSVWIMFNLQARVMM
jgi:cytochrome o ubiquinol oxidase operon protein cyoD